MANVGFATLQIIPSFQGAGAALSSGIAGPASAAGTKAGGLFSDGFSKTVKRFAGPAAVVGAVTGLAKLGGAFDAEFDKIRTATGATGEALGGLTGSFKNVLKGTATDFDSAGTAISTLNQRLGLTGIPLETLSKQILDLSRITDSDLGSNLDAVTGLFNAFGVAAEDQGAKLDELFRASQATGVGVDELAASMASGGSLLKTAGLDFEQSAALLGLLGKTGVSTSSVMAPLSKAIATAAKSGKTASDVFKDTFDAIRDAPNSTKAAGEAIEVFGARAGPKLAGLIREGKLSYEELAASIAGGSDTIAKASTDTEDFGEKWTKIKNRVLVALEPIATRVFDAIGQAMDRLGPLIDKAVMGFSAFRAAFSGDGITSTGFVGAMERIGVAFRDAFEAAKPFLNWLKKNIKPVLVAVGVAFLAVTSPISLIGLALVAAWVKFKDFRTVVATVIAWLAQNVPPAFERIKQVVSDVLAVVVPIVQNVASVVIGAFSAVVEWVRANWPAISEAIGHVLAVVQGAIEGFVAVVGAAWRLWGDDILRVVHAVFDVISTIVETAIGVVRGVIETALALINGDWGEAWDALKGVVSTAWEGIKTLIGEAIDAIVGVLGGLGDAITSAVDGAWDGIWESFKGVINMIIDAWNDLEFQLPSFEGKKVAGKTIIPGWEGPTLGTPNIPRLHGGGMFSAPAGSRDGLALLLDGERVLSPSQTQDFDAGRLAGDTHLHVTQLPGEDQIDAGMRALRWHHTIQATVASR